MNDLANLLNSLSIKQRDEYRNAIYGWMVQFDPHCEYAVTLTLQPEVVKALMNNGYVFSKDDLLKVLKKCMRHFGNRLSRCFYKSAQRNNNKTGLIIPVIEGLAGDERLHYHLVISAPSHLTQHEVMHYIQKSWSHTYLGGHAIDVTRYSDTGWMEYMSKKAIAPKIENIDWDNVRVPPAILQTLS
jgi:hypothetical protein